MRRIAIVGGGIAGLTAAYEITRLGQDGVPIEFVLYESSNRFGGIVETIRQGGFTIETGPDAWVTTKTAASELASELGLAGELIPSNDATRKTWILLPTPGHPQGRLVAMPDGMNMMVPTVLETLEASQSNASLFTSAAISAYRVEPARAAELLASIPAHDESIADFTLRHFGAEVLERVAAPLLSGVFGGDVDRLSVRALMPEFVRMEREHGSILTALQAARVHSPSGTPRAAPAIFTTLRNGMEALVDRLVAAIPKASLRLNTSVTGLQPASSGSRQWFVHARTGGRQVAAELFDAVFLATPLDATRRILTPLVPGIAELLPSESSSAVVVALCFSDAAQVPVPPGFGFLVPPARISGATDYASAEAEFAAQQFAFDLSAPARPPASSLLLACTFADQKFAHRVPSGGRLLRAFFGGAIAERLARSNNDEIDAITRLELARVLHGYNHAHAPLSGLAPSPLPAPVLTVVRRLPASLPQYAVGHLDRAVELESRLGALAGLTILGNVLSGVGIPDLIRKAREAARKQALGSRS